MEAHHMNTPEYKNSVICVCKAADLLFKWVTAMLSLESINWCSICAHCRVLKTSQGIVDINQNSTSKTASLKKDDGVQIY